MKRLISFGMLLVYVACSYIVCAVIGKTAEEVQFVENASSVTNTVFAIQMIYSLVGSLANFPFLPKLNFGQGTLYVTFTQGLCEKIQTSLINTLGSKAPSLQRTKVGYLQALQSAANTAGVTKIPIDPGTGKKKQVRVKFIQRGVEADILETEPENCEGEVEKEPFEDTVDITRYLRTKVHIFQEDEMRKLCEADDEYVAAVIAAQLDPFMVQLNKKLLAIQNANFGAFVPDISPATKKQLQFLKDSGENPRYRGETDLMEDMTEVGFEGRPLVIGAGNIFHYSQMAKIGCCNDGGLNMSQAAAFDYFYDKHFDNITGGPDDMIVMAPGYVQFLTWNKYVGKYAKENDVFSHKTILDPVTGITLDMKVKYDDCDDVWLMWFFLNYEPYFIPSNAYASGDELEGVNYTWLYEATDGAGGYL